MRKKYSVYSYIYIGENAREKSTAFCGIYSM